MHSMLVWVIGFKIEFESSSQQLLAFFYEPMALKACENGVFG